jgi:zeaxanthin glucosyltransferase
MPATRAPDPEPREVIVMRSHLFGGTRPVVFFIDKPKSHLYASMGLARRLEQRGHRVEYWGSPAIQPTVEEQGFGFRRVDGLWSRFEEEVRMRAVSRRLKWLLYPMLVTENIVARRRWLPKMAAAISVCERSVAALVAMHQPVLVVFDPFLLGYYPLFHRLGVKGVVLSTKPLPVRDPLVPPSSSFVMPSRSRAGRRRVDLAWAWVRAKGGCHGFVRRLASRCGLYTHDALVDAVAARCGFDAAAERVERWVRPDLHFRSVDEWALWSPAMDFPRARPLPSNVHYVGPSVDTARRTTPVAVQRAAPGSHLIYVAVGTIRFRWRDHVAFLKRVVTAFGNRPGISVVIATGSEMTTAAIGAVPDNIQLFDFLPQVAMLDVADLAITHAGAGTLRECILKEVPMLAYPNHHDQSGNSARIVYHGLGLRGRRSRDSAATIRRKALWILGDAGVRANLRTMRIAVQRTDDLLLVHALARVGVVTKPPLAALAAH